MEIDSYLKSIKQSISILDKHVGQLREDNSLQIDLVEGEIQIRLAVAVLPQQSWQNGILIGFLPGI